MVLHSAGRCRKVCFLTQIALVERLRLGPSFHTHVRQPPPPPHTYTHTQPLTQVASKCAGSVVDSNIPCCGMAGDRGMRLPELTGSSLQHLGVDGCSDGYSTSRTCEIALSKQAGFNFRGLVYLVDEATRPKARSSSDTAAGGR